MEFPEKLYNHITSRLNPINSLSSENQKKLLDTASLKSYGNGACLFRQGQSDDNVFYLIVGELEMQDSEGKTVVINPDSEQAFYPLSQMLPRQYTANVVSPAHILQFSKSLLDSMMHQGSASQSMEITEVDDDGADSNYDWMTHLLESKIFASIPPENIQKIFVLFEEVTFEKGDFVIKQGDPGDYYYIIKQGEFEVSRQLEGKAQSFKLASLTNGDGFGEEALLGNVPRNASVKAVTNGTLMRITKEIFLDLVTDPAINTIDYEQAQKLVTEGGKWLDVRFPHEHKEFSLEGSANFPLDMIRIQMRKLDPNVSYIIYCDNGARSAIAAYLLLENGYSVSYLQDGVFSYVEKPKNITDKTKLEFSQSTDGDDNKQELLGKDTAADVPVAGSDADSIVKALLEKQTDMDELSKALSTVVGNLFKQLEQALREKAEAEVARNIAEHKLDILQKQKS